MATYQLTVNGQRREVNTDPSTPLLWVLRDDLKLTGTKYGCGISLCGACTVHLDGLATRSCVVPVSMIGDPSPSRRWPRILSDALSRMRGSRPTSCNAATARAGRS